MKRRSVSAGNVCNTFCELSLMGNLVLVNLSINNGNILFIRALYKSQTKVVTRRYSESFKIRLPPYRAKTGMVKGWDKLK